MLRGGGGKTVDPSRLEIPPTLQALVGARLDALETDDRSLVQVAAVLGQSFTLPALVAVADQPADVLEPRLRSLVRREILAVDVDPRSPERGQYGFVQSVIREVALSTLSRRDRRARHLAAARYFESLGDEELAPVLAAHYLDAYRAAPDDEQASRLAFPVAGAGLPQPPRRRRCGAGTPGLDRARHGGRSGRTAWPVDDLRFCLSCG